MHCSTEQLETSTDNVTRIPLLPSNCPFEFKQLQFPIRLSFDNSGQGENKSHEPDSLLIHIGVVSQ